MGTDLFRGRATANAGTNGERDMKRYVVMAAYCLAAAAFAQDGHKHDHDGHDHGDHEKAKSAQTAEMDEAAMMEAWMATAAPGPEHKHMEALAGNWKTVSKHWMQPGAEPSVSEGTCKNEWVLGGRYMQATYKSDFMGQPFEGVGISGYDRAQKRYFSMWIDNMSTQPMMDTGSYDESSKTFTYKGHFMMPEVGKIKSKTVIRVIDANKHVMMMYHAMPGEDEMGKVMELTYERVPAGDAQAS